MLGGGNNEAVLSSDDEEWHSFLVALHDVFGTNSFTVKEVTDPLDPHPFDKTPGIDTAVLPGDLAERWGHIRGRSQRRIQKSLGLWLKNRKGRYAAGWSVVPAPQETHAKVARYAVNHLGLKHQASRTA